MKRRRSMQRDEKSKLVLAAPLSLTPTVALEELPAWAHRYEFITYGYRNPETHATWRAVLLSLFAWHTETVNVHSHLWPGLGCILVLILRVPQDSFQGASPLGQASTAVSCIGCGAMCLLSALAHLMHVHSVHSEAVAWKLDMVGIVVSAWSRLFSDAWVFFGVYLGSSPAFYAIMAVATVLALLTIRRTWQGHFDAAIYFGAICMTPVCIAIVAAAHAQAGEAGAFRQYANWVLASSLCAILGTAIFYKGKVPERFYNPGGALNYLGNSHLFHHAFGALSCYAGFAATPFIAPFERVALG